MPTASRAALAAERVEPGDRLAGRRARPRSSCWPLDTAADLGASLEYDPFWVFKAVGNGFKNFFVAQRSWGIILSVIGGLAAIIGGAAFIAAAAGGELAPVQAHPAIPDQPNRSFSGLATGGAIAFAAGAVLLVFGIGMIATTPAAGN